MQSTKKHICSVEGRHFSTKAALDQHRRTVHSVGAPSGSSSRSRGTFRRGAPRSRGGARGGAGGWNLNPSSIPTTGGSTVVESGEDRLFQGTVQNSTNEQTWTSILDAGMSPRLKALSTAFQRILFLSITIIVTPQMSALQGGGYIAGFVMDPDDAKVNKNTLQSAQGSVCKKWTESAVLRMPAVSTLFYTSRGLEPRTRSPGRFWVIMDNPPTDKGFFVVTIRWKVRLSMPTFDAGVVDHSFFLEGKQLNSYKGNYALVWSTPGMSSTGQLDTSSIYPTPIANSTREYEWFYVPTFNIEYKEGAGDTGTIECHFVAYRPKDKRTYYSQDGVNVETTPWQADVSAQVMIPCGTLLQHRADGCSKNEVLGQLLPQLPSPEVELLRSSLTQLTQRLSLLEQTLRRSSTISPSSSIELLDSPREEPLEQG